MLPVAVSLQAKAVRLAGHGVGAPKSGASATLRKTRAPGAGGRGFRRLSLECNCRRRCRGALLYAAWTRCGTHELHESEHPLTGPPAAGQCPDRSLRRVGEQDQSIRECRWPPGPSRRASGRFDAFGPSEVRTCLPTRGRP